MVFLVMWNCCIFSNVDLMFVGCFDSMDWSWDGDLNLMFFVFMVDDYLVLYEEFFYNVVLVWCLEFGGVVCFLVVQGVQVLIMFDVGFILLVDIGGGFMVGVLGNLFIELVIINNYEIVYDCMLLNGVEFWGVVFLESILDVKGVFGMVFDFFLLFVLVLIYLFDNCGDIEIMGVELMFFGGFDDGFDWDVNYIFKVVEDDMQLFGVNMVFDFEGVMLSYIFNGYVGWISGCFIVDGYVNYVFSIDMFLQLVFGLIISVLVEGYIVFLFCGGWDVNEYVGFLFNVQNVNFGDGEVINIYYEYEFWVWVGFIVC